MFLMVNYYVESKLKETRSEADIFARGCCGGSGHCSLNQGTRMKSVKGENKEQKGERLGVTV